jgi:hypothetical protein
LRSSQFHPMGGRLTLAQTRHCASTGGDTVRITKMKRFSWRARSFGSDGPLHEFSDHRGRHLGVPEVLEVTVARRDKGFPNC